MVNKYTLGGAVLAIVFLALMGMRSAANWLARSNEQTTTQDSPVSADDNRVASDTDNPARSQLNSQSGVPGDQIISQTGDGTANSSPTLSVLDEAGTYIQRQKSAERDPVVAGTDIDVIPAADSSPVPAQNNTFGTQPPASTPPSPTPTPSASPSSPAVPALW